jgi:ABC-2 type transport system permease protein
MPRSPTLRAALSSAGLLRVPQAAPSRGPSPVYDSGARRAPVSSQVRELWNLRRLLRVLIARDVILRYKRSLLGVWWTILNPALTVLVMWAALSGIFHARGVGVPYIVYLLSGVLVINFFQQGVLAAGWSIVGSSGVVAKVHVPPQLFAVSAVLASGVTLLVTFLLLIVLELASGVALGLKALLVPVPLLSLAMLGVGGGLLLAAAAVRLHDLIDFTQVALQLLAFVTPTFYLLSTVSEPVRTLIEINPLTQVVLLLRGLLFPGATAAWWTWASALGAGALALVIGMVVLSRTWSTSVAML